MAKILVLGSHGESMLIFRQDMLKALAQQHEVVACIPESNTSAVTHSIANKLHNMGVRYRPIKLDRTGLNPWHDLMTIYRLYKLFREERADMLFSYTGKPVIFGSIAAKLAGVPNIYSMITGLGSYFVHTDRKSRIVRTIMSNLYKVALGFNKKVFFQNPDDIDDFARNKIFTDSARTVLTNGSGVNIDHFTQLPIPAQKISFLLTCRFIMSKGVMEYLHAAKQIKQQYPEVEFLLVGWYENKDEAIAPTIIQEFVDKGIIKYLGKLDDVRNALAQTSVFVLPSYREGTPKTVLEAMACGRAIITTDVPGCRETVQAGENGMLVPARDIASLRTAIEKFIINPDLITQMGQRSREIAVVKYDVKQVNEVIMQAMEL